jgi:hypothetical protein
LFFEEANKIGKPLASVINRRREKTQIIKIRDGKEDITTNTNENPEDQYRILQKPTLK